MAGDHSTYPAAVHLFLLKANRILLLRRYQTGYEDGSYSVPAGHIDPRESATRAMQREAKEEIGLTLADDQLVVIHAMHRFEQAGRIDFFLVASRWTGEPMNREPDKCDQLRWSPLDDLPTNTIPYIRAGIDAYRRAIPFSEFGWAGAIHPEKNPQLDKGSAASYAR